MQYPAHAAFIAPARARPELWRLLLGLGIIAILYVGVILWIFGILALTNGFDGARAWMAQVSGIGTPASTLLILATFIGMAAGPLAAAAILHDRSIWSVFGPLKRTAKHFGIGAAICAGLYGLLSLIPSASPYTENLSPVVWASVLPIALIGIFVQTGAEEILFRGYLQQQLAARFASPLMWMVLPSAVFAVLHYNPAQFGENTWIVIAGVFLFAVLAADLTAKTGSIGAAWGFHFANNAVAILFISMEGPLSGLALYTMPVQALDTIDMRPLLLVDMATTVVTWAVIRYAVRR